MDVLNPQIEIIDGIPYRVNYSDDFNALINAEKTPYIEFGDDEKEVECGGEIVEAEEGDVQIEQLDDGYYVLQVHVPRDYHSVIVGPRGGTRQRIELETKTYIDVPRKTETGDVEIKGKNRVGVLAACRRIKVLVDAARAKSPFTHFVSIPMTGAEVVKNFILFKKEVLENCGKSPGICEGLFQNPFKLHLTVVVVLLADAEERDLATNVMIACKEDIINPMFNGHALRVRVRGLEIMNDDPSEVKVLYGKVEDPTGCLLQELVDRIADYFVDAGLVEKSRDSVKLHMTLMSSIFLSKKSPNDDQGRRESTYKHRKWFFFDASKIVELYRDFDFGIMEINKIHLSQRHTQNENGYWTPSCQLTFY